MAGIDNRIAKLEAQLCPPEREAEPISEQAIRDLDELARIVRDSGPQLANARERVQEQHPDWSHYHQQLEAKRILILASGSDGPRLWRLLASAVDHFYKPPHVRDG